MMKIMNTAQIKKYYTVVIFLVIISVIIVSLLNLNKIQNSKKLSSEEKLKIEARSNIESIIQNLKENVSKDEGKDATIEDLKQELLKYGYVLESTSNEIQYDENITITINKNLQIEKIEKPTVKVYYQVCAVNGNIADALVTIEGKEIEQIVCQDITIEAKNRGKIVLDRKFEEDKEYKIDVKLQNEEIVRSYNLIYSTNPRIEILNDEFIENEEEKNIEITYPNNENLINYYSLDDGVTWIKSEEGGNKQQLKVRVSDKYTITAKSISKEGKTIYNEKIFYKFALSESLLQATNEQIIKGNYYRINIKNEDYYAHTYIYNEDTTISENTTYGDINDVASANEYARHTVIVKINGNLNINNNVQVTAYRNNYGGPKGMLVYVTGTLENKGTITMTARGAKAIGQNLYLWENADKTNSEYEYVPKDGANGGAAAYGTGSNKGIQGNRGANGINRQTGGGASGGIYLAGSRGTYSGAGTRGTSYSGGTGGRRFIFSSIHKWNIAICKL